MKRAIVFALFLAACNSGSGGRSPCIHVLTPRDSISSDWGAESDDANVLEGGVCLDPGDAGLGDIEVVAEAGGRRVSAKSDGDGHYVLRDVPSGSVRVTARGAGYAAADRVVVFGGCGSSAPGGGRVDYDPSTCRHRQWVAFHLKRGK